MSREDVVAVMGSTLVAGAIVRALKMDPIQSLLVSFAIGYLIGRTRWPKSGGTS